MGTFVYPLTLTSDGKTMTVEALVDTGSTFTTLPEPLLRELGIPPFAKIRVKLANGQTELDDIGEITAQIDDYSPRTVICAFSPPDAPAVLGAHTLEAFVLGVDPVAKQLVPVDAFWAGSNA